MTREQGSRFTSLALDEPSALDWRAALPLSRMKTCAAGRRMDGKGRCLDNIFLERLRRTRTCVCAYLHASKPGSETKAAILEQMTFYNHQCPHSAQGGKPPALVDGERHEINHPDRQAKRLA